MSDRSYTRRQLLAGLAGASGIGAAVGTGTAAMVTDEAIFSGGSIRSGEVELDVDWATDGESGSSGSTLDIPVAFTGSDRTQTVDLTVHAPDRAGATNPAAVWLRAPCPEDGTLARALDVTLRYANCSEDCELFAGSLWDLTAGVPIDADGDASVATGEQACLDPGQSLDLELAVELTDFEGYGSAEFGLEFVGTQCRNTDRGNPFDAADGCGSGGDPRHAVSYVAFCSSAADSLDPTVSVTSSDDGGDPLRVSWQTAVDVDFVAVKASTGLTVYDLRDAYRDTGSAFAGDSSAAVPSVTLEPGEAATPCEVAASELGADPAEVTRSTKLEWENGDWRVDE